jgi:hypothetical protein
MGKNIHPILAINPGKTKQSELDRKTLPLLFLPRQARDHWLDSSIAHIVKQGLAANLQYQNKSFFNQPKAKVFF